MKPLLAAILLFGLAGTAEAHGVSAGDIEIIHPNIPQPAPTAATAAGYLAIANGGSHPDRLIGIETEVAAKAQLHETRIGPEGVATMAHVEGGVEIPAGDTLVLEPGGLHIMLMGLKVRLSEGEMVPATLIFEEAGRVEVEFMIDPPGAEGHGHADHGAAAPARP